MGFNLSTSQLKAELIISLTFFKFEKLTNFNISVKLISHCSYSSKICHSIVSNFKFLFLTISSSFNQVLNNFNVSNLVSVLVQVDFLDLFDFFEKIFNQTFQTTN
jgi:hypothetical protein